MRICALYLIGIFLLFSQCGQLPREERQAYAEEMEQRKIRRITSEEILAYLQEEVEHLDSLTVEQRSAMKSELFDYSAMRPGEASDEKLRELISAYMFSAETGENPGANIQTIDSGNFLVTFPVFEDSAGIRKLEYLQTFRFSKRELIRAISEERE